MSILAVRSVAEVGKYWWCSFIIVIDDLQKDRFWKYTIVKICTCCMLIKDTVCVYTCYSHRSGERTSFLIFWWGRVREAGLFCYRKVSKKTINFRQPLLHTHYYTLPVKMLRKRYCFWPASAFSEPRSSEWEGCLRRPLCEWASPRTWATETKEMAWLSCYTRINQYWKNTSFHM